MTDDYSVCSLFFGLSTQGTVHHPCQAVLAGRKMDLERAQVGRRPGRRQRRRRIGAVNGAFLFLHIDAY